MNKYYVTISRTETIIFAVDAESPEEAESIYLLDGDEINGEVVSTEVLSVTAPQGGDN